MLIYNKTLPMNQNGQNPHKINNQVQNNHSYKKILNDSFSIQNKKKQAEIKKQKEQEFNAFMNFVLLSSVIHN